MSDRVKLKMMPRTVLKGKIGIVKGSGTVADGNKVDITVSGGDQWIVNNNRIGNAKLTDMPQNTVKGRFSVGTGDPENVTTTQLTSILDLFNDTQRGLTPPSGGGSTSFLRADGTWAVPAGGGGGGSPGGSTQQMQFNDAGNFGGAAQVTWNKTTNSFSINSDTLKSDPAGNYFKLRPWADVMAYGAKPDGANTIPDSGPAFRAAVAAVKAFGGGTVYIPTGYFRIITTVDDGAPGTGAIRFLGGPAAYMDCGTSDVELFHLNNRGSSIENINATGSNFANCTKDIIVIGAGAVEGKVANCNLSGGRHCITCNGTDHILENNICGAAYGSSQVLVAGTSSAPDGSGSVTGYHRRNKLDWYVLTGSQTGSAPGTPIGDPWQASQVYAVNDIVRVNPTGAAGGYFLRCTAGGMSSSGSEPSVAGAKYSTFAGWVPIADGPTVQWELYAPTTHYGLEVNGATFSLYCSEGDYTGFFTAGIGIVNTNGFLSPQSPGSIYISEGTFGAQWQSCIWVAAGNDVRITNCQFAGNAHQNSLNGAGVRFTTGHAGESEVANCTFMMGPIGIVQENPAAAPNNPRNFRFHGNGFYGLTAACIYVSGNTTDFSITGNIFGNSSAWGASVGGVIIDAGPATNYKVIGNTFYGANTVQDAGTGLMKVIERNNAFIIGAAFVQCWVPAVPASPVAGSLRLYPKDVGGGALHWFQKDSTGLELDLTGGGRETLTAARTYYVRTSGNDSSGDGSLGAPFATGQKAWDTAIGKLDFKGFVVTIDFGAGTFDAPMLMTSPPVGGTVTMNGAGAGSTTLTSTTILGGGGQAVIDLKCPTILTIQNLKMASVGGAPCLFARDGGKITFGTGLEFGSSPGSMHIQVGDRGTVEINNSYTISGGAYFHLNASRGSISTFAFITVTLTGAMAFNTFANCSTEGLISSYGITYSLGGAVTGKRYNVDTNAVTTTFGSGVNFFPGDGTGTTPSGGVYV